MGWGWQAGWECCRGGVLDVIGSALTCRVIVIGIDGRLSQRQKATRLGRVLRGWPLAVIFNYRGLGQSWQQRHLYIQQGGGGCVCMCVHWERGGKGEEHESEQEGGRKVGGGWDSGLCSWVWCGNWALTSVTLPLCQRGPALPLTLWQFVCVGFSKN